MHGAGASMGHEWARFGVVAKPNLRSVIAKLPAARSLAEHKAFFGLHATEILPKSFRCHPPSAEFIAKVLTSAVS